jgi:hypothetical protein
VVVAERGSAFVERVVSSKDSAWCSLFYFEVAGNAGLLDKSIHKLLGIAKS